MRTNYQRGKETEKRIRRVLESRGFYVMESRGSHGEFDLIAVGQNRILLIQSKRTKQERISLSSYKDDLLKMRDVRERVKIPENAALELWVWRDNMWFDVFDENGNHLREEKPERKKRTIQ